MIVPEKRYGYLTLLGVAFRRYPKRAVLGATLMITQSFLYNAIFFTYALVLTSFTTSATTRFRCTAWRSRSATWPALLLLGQLFDSVGLQEDDLRHLSAVPRPAGLQCLAVRCRGC